MSYSYLPAMISTWYSGRPSSQSKSKSMILPFATPSAICLALASPIRLGLPLLLPLSSSSSSSSSSSIIGSSGLVILSISDPSIILSISIPVSCDMAISSLRLRPTKSSIIRSGFNMIIFLMKVILPTVTPYRCANSTTVLLSSRACVNSIGLRFISSNLS